VECRVGGADLNPYLAFAALLAAGLDGVEKKMKLEPVFSGDAYDTSKALREIPKTLRDATSQLDGSKFMRSAFGDEVIDHYAHTAKWEQNEYDKRVVDLDLMRGFEQY
jgi:glutamine synthetase